MDLYSIHGIVDIRLLQGTHFSLPMVITFLDRVFITILAEQNVLLNDTVISLINGFNIYAIINEINKEIVMGTKIICFIMRWKAGKDVLVLITTKSI